MNEDYPHVMSMRVTDEHGNILLEHTSYGHSRDGACQAYGHALTALLKHYKEKREDETATQDARLEASRTATRPHS